MRRHYLILICIFLAACRRSTLEPRAPLSRATQAVETVTEATGSKRPVYPYSIVEGGAYTPFELKLAKQKDPVVAKHYRNVNPDALKPLRLVADTPAYVSYRVGNLVFWTAHKINLKRGELILSDDTNWVRGRCGNQISETPMFPTLTPARLAPKAEAFDSPATVKAMTPYPAEMLIEAVAAPLDAPPVAIHHAMRDKPNVPLPATQPGEQSWAYPSSPSTGAIMPLGGAGGGGSSPGPPSPGWSGTTSAAVTGYPPNPFQPPSPITNFWTNTLLSNLPPYQSILTAISGPLPETPVANPIDINSPPAYIAYRPQPAQPAIPYSAYYPLVSDNWPPAFPYNPSAATPTTDFGPLNSGSTPTHSPGSAPRQSYLPSDVSPKLSITPDSQPNLATPEPATVVVTGISLLILAGYYLLARIRIR